MAVDWCKEVLHANCPEGSTATCARPDTAQVHPRGGNHALAGPRLDACRDPSRRRAGRCHARDCPAAGALLDSHSSQYTCSCISTVSTIDVCPCCHACCNVARSCAQLEGL